MRPVRRTCRERPCGRVAHDWDAAFAKPLEGQRGLVDLWPLFRSLRHGSLVVVRGGESDILLAETLTRMQVVLPHLDAVVGPGMGHAPTLSEPQIPEPLNDALQAADRANRTPRH